jgi:hypothetical protein
MTPTGQRSFIHEGPLRQALTRIFEDARAAKVKSLSSINIKLTELLDASRMLTVVGGAAGATTKVTFEGHYATETGGEFEFAFRGTVDDALPIKDFLGPQFRVSTEKECIANFSVAFPEGLMLANDSPERLIEKLTQQAVGAAFVVATAEVL